MLPCIHLEQEARKYTLIEAYQSAVSGAGTHTNHGPPAPYLSQACPSPQFLALAFAFALACIALTRKRKNSPNPWTAYPYLRLTMKPSQVISKHAEIQHYKQLLQFSPCPRPLHPRSEPGKGARGPPQARCLPRSTFRPVHHSSICKITTPPMVHPHLPVHHLHQPKKADSLSFCVFSEGRSQVTSKTVAKNKYISTTFREILLFITGLSEQNKHFSIERKIKKTNIFQQ